MREWILNNTDITEKEYDSLINPETLYIEGESNPTIKDTNKIFEHPMLAIDLFTQQKPTLLTQIKYHIIKKENYYIHKHNKFIILAIILPEMQEILYSTNRKGKCFELSLNILKKYHNANIVIAMCANPNCKEYTPFLHAITLVKNESGNEYILDTTYNVIMEKETYLNLFKANIISIIPREQFKNEYPIIVELLKNKSVYLDEYLCFPEQVITAAKRLTKAKK